MLIEIKSVKQSSIKKKINKPPHPFHTVIIALSFHHQTVQSRHCSLPLCTFYQVQGPILYCNCYYRKA